MLQKHFKLEQVLKYRIEIEREKIQEFFSARQKFEHAANKLELEEQLLKELAEDFRNRQQELETIDDIRMHARFFTRKHNDVKRGKEQVANLGSIMNHCRETLLDATKDKKALESLKEKKAHEFMMAMAQKEQLFMDEISIQKKKSAE